MKKKIAYILTLVLLISVACFSFTGCKKEEAAPEITGYSPKAPYQAKHLDVIELSGLTVAEHNAIASLQGLLARKTDQQIYFLDSTAPAYQMWLDKLVADFGVTYDIVNDPWELLEKYSDYYTGYSLYDNNYGSLNVATSYAGVRDAVLFDLNMQEAAKTKLPGIKRVFNACGLDENIWTPEILEREGFSKDIVFQIADTTVVNSGPVYGYVRDYAVMNGAVAFFGKNLGEMTAAAEVLSKHTNTDAVLMGWSTHFEVIGNESDWIIPINSLGFRLVAADYCNNLSVLSGFKSKYDRYYQQIETEVPEEENVHYVTFIMSDGDNIQWLNRRGLDPKWWGSPSRGTTPITWTMCSSGLEIIPTVMDWHYETKYATDDFIVSCGGDGTVFPSGTTKAARKMQAARLNKLMDQMDVGTMLSVDVQDFYAEYEQWEEYTKIDSLDGIFYSNWSPNNGGHDAYRGDIRWMNGKPILTSNAYFGEVASGDAIVNRVNNEGSRDVTKPGAYTWVYVECWSGRERVSEIQALIDQFDDDVRVVNSAQMISAIQRNITEKTPFGA